MIPFWFLRKRRHSPIIKTPSIGRSLASAALLIAALGSLHVLAMIAYEDMPAFDGLWLTLTTLFTVGYGDLAAKSFEGRWATILLLYFGGIYTLANFASQWFEWRTDAKIRKWRGLWRWHMRDHLLILNSPSDHPAAYFERLIQQLRQTQRWKDLAQRLAGADVGIALGYESTEGAVMVNPPHGTRVSARAVFALISGEPVAAHAKVLAALRAP